MSTVEVQPFLSFGGMVCSFLGRDGDDAMARADETSRHIGMLALAYTRGRGFVYNPVNGGYDVNADLVSVIVIATARLMSNPAQVESESADGWSASGGFKGWTIAEMKVLNQYRRMTA